MANYMVTDTDLTAVANAIRTKGGTSTSLSFPSGFVNAIGNISGGGGPTGGAWEQKTVTIPTTMQTADVVAAYFLNEIDDARYAFAVKDDYDKTQWSDNQLIAFLIFDGQATLYIRYRSNAVNYGPTMSASYSLVASQGEKYTILYQ